MCDQLEKDVYEKDVEGCSGHPSSHIACYTSGGTGIYHMCQYASFYPKIRDLKVCLARYKKSLQNCKTPEQWDR